MSTLIAVSVILERPVKRLAGTVLAEVVGVGCEKDGKVSKEIERGEGNDATHDLLR